MTQPSLYETGRELLERNDLDGAIAAFTQSALLEPHFKTYELLGEAWNSAVSADTVLS